MNDDKENSIVYVLDANILMGFDTWMPIELNINKSFWNFLEEALKNKKWVLLDVVVNEVKYEGDLKEWCKKQKNSGHVSALSDGNRNRGIEINDKYPIIDETTRRSQTDPYIIAYAEENKLKVLSREGTKKQNEKLNKIPDVCRMVGVGCERNPLIFYKHIGYGI